MTASKPALPIALDDRDEVPELTDDWFDRADLKMGDRIVRRGRPPLGAAPKRQVTMRLDADVLEKLRASGEGWQGRVNDVLREYVEKNAA
ncbi:BrnA antitoxin family protein [Methylobacterium sp. sgz302541]|uniref:BrnA antitoxin family protein n=1 Tax=unclassified Methylobacterium TaxID=2615210 RepID=UPI003D325794